MNQVVADFDADQWQASGLQWARGVKGAGLHGLVVDYGLGGPAKEVLDQMGIKVVSPFSKTGSRECDTLFTLAEESHDLTMYARELPSRYREMMVAAQAGGLVGYLRKDDHDRVPSPVDAFVFPLTNIEARIRAARAIMDKVIKPLGGIVGSDVLCAQRQEWQRFAGFFSYALAVAQIEPRFGMLDLYLNYYGASFPGTVKIFK